MANNVKKNGNVKPTKGDADMKFVPVKMNEITFVNKPKKKGK